MTDWKKKGLEILIPPTEESLVERKSHQRESQLARLIKREHKHTESLS
jgi:hypothetical protein